MPLIIEERRSKACRQLVRADPTQIVFCFTRTEILSALCRRHREGLLDAADLRIAEARLNKLADLWTEVDARRPIRDAAEQLLRTHPLRAADSLQLGACIVVFGKHRRDRELVVLDDLLAEAARQEGFKVVVPRPGELTNEPELEAVRPNEGLVTDGWVRVAHPPAAQPQAVGRAELRGQRSGTPPHDGFVACAGRAGDDGETLTSW